MLASVTRREGLRRSLAFIVNSTLSTVIKDRQKPRLNKLTSIEPEKKRMRTSSYEDVEDALQQFGTKMFRVKTSQSLGTFYKWRQMSSPENWGTMDPAVAVGGYSGVRRAAESNISQAVQANWFSVSSLTLNRFHTTLVLYKQAYITSFIQHCFYI